jgi:hypothetical protein
MITYAGNSDIEELERKLRTTRSRRERVPMLIELARKTLNGHRNSLYMLYGWLAIIPIRKRWPRSTG